MRRIIVIAAAFALATLSFGATSAQSKSHDDKNPPAKGGHDKGGGKSGGHSNGKSGGGNNGGHQNSNVNSGGQGNGGGHSNVNSGGQGNGGGHQNSNGNSGGGGNNGQGQNSNGKNRSRGEVRPGQIVIPAKRNWTPDRSHRYHSSSYVKIDIWAAGTFGYAGHTYNWDPSAWHYWVEPSLMRIVYRSERMSNSLRDSFERQMTQQGLRSTRGGQNAWDRVQRMDESLEKLRSEAGYVSQSVMLESATDTLELAQLVAKSFNRHANLEQLVANQWDDLRFELNELARYYDVPGID